MIWVAPLLASTRSSHRFIEMARSLAEDDQTADLAVVAAQIHLELHVKALISHAVAQDVSPLRWRDYTDHIKRRNAISHRGQTVSVADAEASIAVVEDLWMWLNAAAVPDSV